MKQQLRSLEPGQIIPFGGDQFTRVSAEVALAFVPGDQLIVVQDDGALLHIPQAECELVASAVDAAMHSFSALRGCSDEQITAFYSLFAQLLGNDEVFAAIAQSNAQDVMRANSLQRSTTRLVLSASMRDEMIAGLAIWSESDLRRDEVVSTVQHAKWSVTTRRAPLGVVGFVFEGRPNVFADAAGVLRSGNSALLRIGSDALGTAEAIMTHAVQPALAQAGLPAHAVGLLRSASRASGWALFNDQRLSLAVARGSGQAVRQLGAVARQAGVPASLHGTGGSWMVVSAQADIDVVSVAILNSLDRKVCNTLNVCCVQRSAAATLIPIVIDAVSEAGRLRDTAARLHVLERDVAAIDPALLQLQVLVSRADGDHREPMVTTIRLDDLGHEWEWENSPELTLVLVDSISQAAELFNRWSPRLAASLLSNDQGEHDEFYQLVDAPFVGNGMTRWVDGQFALNRPELGLSNWANGRLLARSAVLSGDSVFTQRLFADVRDPALRR